MYVRVEPSDRHAVRRMAHHSSRLVLLTVPIPPSGSGNMADAHAELHTLPATRSFFFCRLWSPRSTRGGQQVIHSSPGDNADRQTPRPWHLWFASLQ